MERPNETIRNNAARKPRNDFHIINDDVGIKIAPTCRTISKISSPIHPPKAGSNTQNSGDFKVAKNPAANNEIKLILLEVHRTLKKNGELFITTPNYFSIWPFLELIVNDKPA